MSHKFCKDKKFLIRELVLHKMQDFWNLKTQMTYIGLGIKISDKKKIHLGNVNLIIANLFLKLMKTFSHAFAKNYF